MKSDVKATLYSKAFLLHFLPTAVVFFAFLSITFWAYLSSVNSLSRQQQQVINDETKEVQSALSSRLTVYEEFLRSAGKFFNASNEVLINEWQRYVSFEDLSTRYPGITNIGFVAAVDEVGLPLFLEQARASVDPSYSLKTIGEGQFYTPILYVTPLDMISRLGLGYDTYSDSVRRAAINKAINSNQIMMTAKLKLFQDQSDTEQNKPGFIMYAPVYYNDLAVDTVDARKTAVRGLVYGAFRAEDLFKEIFKNTDQKNFSFRIYTEEKTKDKLLYQSSGFDASQNDPEVINNTKIISHYGTTWLIDYKISSQIVPNTFRDRPLTIFAAGSLLSVLTAGLVFTLLVARTRSLASLKEREVQTAKDDLLSLASHQLRTPATGVKQYVGMVLEGYAGSLKNEQRMYLEKAYESNERQLHIINELLYVAKADAGRIVLARRDIRINELIKDIVSELRQTAKDNDISLRVKVPTRDRLVNADKHCLRMAIENLITNAIKYTPSGGKVKVAVMIENKILEISVKDSGVGIDVNDQAKLFTRFSRIPNKLSTKTSGSGIGLYLAYSLIKMHGGDITVFSEIDKGTTFTVHMPLNK